MSNASKSHGDEPNLEERLHDPARDLVLVDMDGTLADVTHRLHYIKGAKKNWKRFFQCMHEDPPHEVVLAWVRNLAPEYRVVIVTGRPDTYRQQTIEWLARHDVKYDAILMRPSGDHRPDYVVKKELLGSVDKDRVAFVIDDRPNVCDMWRDCGLRTIQLSMGESY